MGEVSVGEVGCKSPAPELMALRLESHGTFLFTQQAWDPHASPF